MQKETDFRLGSILTKWYESFKRDLPWRYTTDPYIIWLSEIILQQTRVNQGYGYFVRFVERFPDVRSLAAAPGPIFACRAMIQQGEVGAVFQYTKHLSEAFQAQRV